MLLKQFKKANRVVKLAFTKQRIKVILENIIDILFDFPITDANVHFEVVLQSGLLEFLNLEFQVVAAGSFDAFKFGFPSEG